MRYLGRFGADGKDWWFRPSALGCSARWPLPAPRRPGWVAGLPASSSGSWVAGLRLPVQRGLKLSWVAGRVIGPPPSWVAGLRAVPDSWVAGLILPPAPTWVAGWTTIRQSWAAGLLHRYRRRPGPMAFPTGPGVCCPGKRWPRATRSRSDPDARAIAGQFRERGVKPALVLSSSPSLITVHLSCRFTALFLRRRPRPGARLPQKAATPWTPMPSLPGLHQLPPEAVSHAHRRHRWPHGRRRVRPGPG